MKLDKIDKSVIASVIFIGILVTSTVLIFSLINSNNGMEILEETYSGVQVSYDEIPQSEPIIILNPKDFNIFYDSRYEREHDNILINYKVAPGVNVTEYILDGWISQQMPADNLIPTPPDGNHTLKLIGTNSSGSSCSSEVVDFYISNAGHNEGVLGEGPRCSDWDSISTIDPYRFIENGHYKDGLVVKSLWYEQNLFIEGPDRNFIPSSLYVKSHDLRVESVRFYSPLIVLRSEPWYIHELKVVDSRWAYIGENKVWMTTTTTMYAGGGIDRIIYYRFDMLHVFGSVTFWNGETQYYDVFQVFSISFDNPRSVSYDEGEPFLEVPILGPLDFSQTPGLYNDKETDEGFIWSWTGTENWVQSQGFHAQIFLGNYAGSNSCPVPIQVYIPYSNSIHNNLTPNEFVHNFTRGSLEPDNYDPNYRGLENTFSMNIIPT